MLNEDRFDYSVIPKPTMDALERHINQGVPVGDFLTGVLTNDLAKAVSHADPYNQHALVQIVCWLHNHAPAACYGSEEKVKAWRELRRSGKKKEGFLV